jgi:hypothetical protein
MAQEPQSNKPNKHALRDAQARHQSALFGGQDVSKPSAQRAESESRQRSQALGQAAAQKQQQLTPEEQQKLAELQAKSQAGAREQAARPAPPSEAESRPPQPRPQQAPPRQAPDARTAQLHQAAQRSDLTAAAISNMQQNLKQTPPPASPPRPQPAPAPRPASPAPAPQRQSARSQQAPARPAGKRPAPNPEELDKLLREMAQRSAARRQAAGGQAPPPPRPAGRGPERVDAAPVAEAPPEPPPEVAAEEEKSPEKQAEILRELKSREATAQRDIKPIPQADQERAEERPVEATVPIHTEGNAVSAAPLHAAIADLQSAMRAHDAPGQVTGVNQVQRSMPSHPLYDPKESHGA